MTDVALRFTAIDAGLSTGFAKVNKQLGDLQTQVEKSSQGIASSFNAIRIAASAIAIGSLTASVVAYADEVTKASIRTGIAAEEVQKLQFIAGQADVEFDQITSAINKFQRQLVEGSKDAAQGLQTIGTSIEEIRDLSPDKQFQRIAEGIAAIHDPAQRVATSVDLFGKSGAELLPVLESVGSEMGAITAHFEALGGAVDAKTIANVEELGDNFDALTASAKSLATELLGLVARPFTIVLNAAGEGVGALRGVIADTKFAISGGADSQEIAFLTRQIKELEKAAGDYDKQRDGEGPSLSGLLTRDDMNAPIFDEASSAKLLKIARDRLEFLQIQKRLESELGEKPPAVHIDLPTGIAGLALGDKEQAALDKSRRDAEQEGRENDKANLRDLIQVNAEDDYKALSDQLDTGISLEASAFDERRRLAEEYHTDAIQFASDAAASIYEINKAFGLQQVDFEQLKTESILGLSEGLFGALASESAKAAKIFQAVELAKAVWWTASGVTNALASVPWPANLAAAAKVALIGGAQIAKIKSTKVGGGGDAPSLAGGSSASAGGSPASRDPVGATAPSDQGIQSKRVLQVLFNGPVFNMNDFKDMLVKAIQEEVNDRDVVIFSGSSRQAQEIRE